MVRTNAFSILCVFVRVFALWLFVSAVIEIPAMYAMASRNQWQGLSLQGVLGGSLFQIAIATTLWIFADKLARLALARPQQVVLESDIPVVEWQAIAFSVLGLWQLVEGIAYLTSRIVRIVVMYFAVEGGRPHVDLPDDYYAWLVADGLRVLIGLSLLFGARGLVGLIRRYRQVGQATGAASLPDVDGPGPPASA